MKKDVLIIGAGPAGLSLACSLAPAGLQIGVVEKQAVEELHAPAFDGRDIALTHLSRRILTELGVWERIPPAEISPILQARVLDGVSPYVLGFDHPGAGDEPLGYLVSNHQIRRALFSEVQGAENVELIAQRQVVSLHTAHRSGVARLSDGQEIEAALIVAADSRFSECRRWMGIATQMLDFGRVVIVCRMAHERPHRGIAYECFHYGRTLAVLPLSGNRSSIIITVSAHQADEICDMDVERFNRDIEARFNARLGSMELDGKRYPYPLVAVHADRFVARRFALLGDAAVGMHPVTAHGFNLGLRGQDTLAGLVRAAHAAGRDFASAALLERYASRHRRVTWPLYTGTNAIVRLYTREGPLSKILRKAALRLGNNCPPLKRVIVNQLTEDGPPRKSALG